MGRDKCENLETNLFESKYMIIFTHIANWLP